MRDIMIPYDSFRLVDGKTEAKRFFEEHKDYDYTASPKTGEITTFYRRGELEGHPLRHEDLVSDGTRLLDLLDLLVHRDFFFVLSGNRICGFVHFSDLNNELMKLPLFVLLAALERRLWLGVRGKLTEADLKEALTTERFVQVRQRLEEARGERVDRDWEGLLFFSEILKVAKKSDLLDISNRNRGYLIDTRNRVAHHDRLLVERHKDVRRLAAVRDLCQEVLDTSLDT